MALIGINSSALAWQMEVKETPAWSMQEDQERQQDAR